MEVEQAFNILSLVTEPNVKLTRLDYVNIQAALETIAKFIQENSKKKE